MSTNAENYDTIDDHRENSDDDDSWGSDFDDASVNINHSREIEDNIINEDLEAQLNQVLSLSSGSNTSLPESSSAPAAESTYSNVNVAGNALSVFSYTRSNDISAVSSNRFINKYPGNQRTPELSTTPVQERMAVATSSNNLAVSNEATQRISPASKNNIRAGCSDNKQNLNQNSELNGGNKAPGKLKADAFAFLKNIPSKRSANDDMAQDKGRKHLVATAFVHAIKLEQQNLSRNSAINVSDEKYEWETPIPSAPRSSSLSSDTDEEDLRINPQSFHNRSESNNLRSTGNMPTFTNVKPEVSKPPLPSRPPPIFALGKRAKANASVTSDKPQLQISAGRSKKPAPAEVSSSLQTGHQSTSVGKLTAVVKEKSLESRLQESFRPVPLTAPALYPIIDESSSSNENAATTSPEISVAPPLPKTKPRPSLHMHLSKDENLSQSSVQCTPAVKSHFGNLHERNKQHNSFETEQNKTEVEINVPKFRRSMGSMDILLEAKQPYSSSTIIQAADMEQKPKPLKPISPIDDENWPNYLSRPQLPQKLKQTHRSLSCSSLVQSFKEMSLPKRNQPEKVKTPFEPPKPRITEAPKPTQRTSKEVILKVMLWN
ncbi:hypothetical protein X975_26179, partial [Stegodyphus mimosarum]